MKNFLSCYRSRFKIYHLEDNDFFIKDFTTTAQFIHPSNKDEIVSLDGILIISTKSLVFEPKDERLSIVKFHFRYMMEKPKVKLIDKIDYLKLKVKKVIEIPNKPINFRTIEYTTDVHIKFTYETIDTLIQLIYDVYQRFISNQPFYDVGTEENLPSLIHQLQFEYSRIKSMKENFILKKAEKVRYVLPLVDVSGLFMMTDERAYFQSFFSMEIESLKGFAVKLKSINQIYKRSIRMNNTGLELVAYSLSKKREKMFLLNFDSEESRNNIFKEIVKQRKALFDANSENPPALKTNFDIAPYTKLWVEGAISNFEYLVLVNNSANRTKLDLSQYPVFPWVLADYTSSVLRLNDDSIYRDLSKPIGALNEKRLQSFIARYKDMAEPAYFYGTHYSNPAYASGYLFRKNPFWMLKLNGGKFDHEDRLFNSIQGDWNICNNDSGSVKELIPEFYEEDTSFLINHLDLDYINGASQKEKIKVSPTKYYILFNS